jgi:hypothetical protein
MVNARDLSDRIWFKAEAQSSLRKHARQSQYFAAVFLASGREGR